MKKIVACLVLCIGAANASAAMILGLPSCGEWMQGGANTRWWFAGYLSALAADTAGTALAQSGSTIDPLAGQDPRSLELWMDKYCRENPLDNVDLGAMKLINELVQRTRPQAKPTKK